MIATEYKTRLKHKEKCCDGGMAFYFDKPPGFEFEAGQYIDLTLINPLRPILMATYGRFLWPARQPTNTC